MRRAPAPILPRPVRRAASSVFAVLPLLVALLLTACGNDVPVFEPDYDVSLPDGGADARQDGVAYDAPEITAPAEPVALDSGGTTTVDLLQVVHDPDTPFTSLAVTATPSDHITASIAGATLTLTAAEGFEGTEQIGLRAEDPFGNVGTGELTVVVTGEEQPPVEDLVASPRSCDTVFTWDTFHGAASTVSLAGEFNDWSTTTTPLADDGSGVFSVAVALPPGEYGYKLVLNGDDWREDPENPYRIEVDGIQNSLVLAPDCDVPLLELVAHQANTATGTVVWELEAWDASTGAGLDGETLSLSVNRAPVPASAVAIDGSHITVTLSGLDAPDRYTLRASVADVDGRPSEALYAPVWLEAQPFLWNDAVVYFAFVDRLANGDTGNDAPQPADNPLVDWMGGDWAGLLDVLESGYFEDLGVNTLWLTAPNDNPDTLVTGSLGDLRTAYHGYFPSAARAPENHFGSLADVRAVVDAAHAHGMRVITDFVANHVFETHPYYASRASDDEFNPYEGCRETNWEHPVTCWFETYLPDFDYSRRDNVRRTAADAVWWIRELGLDGFRMDAVKHMDHNVGLVMRAEIDRLHTGTGLHFYMIGETFTGTWTDEEADLIAAYVSPGELSGQFDFPVYWEIVRTVLRREAGFEEFGSMDFILGLSEARFPPPALMGTFAGNHDVPRMTSHAAGQIADMWGNGSQQQALDDPPPQPADAAPYARDALALTLLLTLPGVPTLYYGDEVGLAGAGDPDNRRFMPDDAALNSYQLALRDRVSQLGHLRHDRVELRRGERTTLAAANVYVFARDLNGQVTLVAVNNAPASESVDVPVSSLLSDGTTLTDLDGGTVTVTAGRVAFEVAGTSARVFTSP